MGDKDSKLPPPVQVRFCPSVNFGAKLTETLPVFKSTLDLRIVDFRSVDLHQ